MVHLMNNARGKILLLVEGERLEKLVFKELSRLYGLKSEIFCLRCNIFMLYNVMKQYDFNASIKDILTEKSSISIYDEDRDILTNNKFAYTYLILDFDLQHSINNVELELKQIREMCEYFKDETDDTIGKLYINYPMMESFRDRDDFIDEKFMNKIVCINDFVKYKEIAGKCKLSSTHINNYKKEGFDEIIKSNLNKASVKLFENKIFNYHNYLKFISAMSMFEKQCLYVAQGYVYVLNTSLFLLIDYFGERFFNFLFVTKNNY